jgi:hypothetical protein
MKTVFGLPDTSVATAYPKRDTVIGEMTICLCGKNTEPERKDDCESLAADLKKGGMRSYSQHSALA